MQSMQQPITQAAYPYLLFLPQRYEEQSWPLILFLHGAGERGSDLNRVKQHGIAKLVEEQANFPFITVSPQCPQGQHWQVSLLSTLLDQVTQTYRVDPSRIYLTGLSMGGYGTWYLAAAQPQRFAAIAPICGGGNPKQACELKDLPVWAFHGARDRIVPLSETELMVKALEACGGNVKFTIYPEAGHNSWTQTYNNPDLYAWFLEHRSRLDSAQELRA
ncbi:prolyl oligopeptidase family serine peptidase [Leptolyngbya sp. FACHB-261]|uniref:carboxylesterase family protein n=1 Tax=Leptolyngbya sp. FACHB-261 TaxID=2692806 RepID=UPI001687C399|nr:prolyl oligopeptidase family serine peptidase [Leptolyngbya sp. FACHB-261]MBD2100050.1 prolyl oligopeptidase family serine peptidase [Leptolyngbya sp. FACHB-261]